MLKKLKKSRIFLIKKKKIRLKKINKKLLLDFDVVSSTLFEMSDIYTELYDSFKNFNHSVGKNEKTKLEEIILTIQNSVVNWGKFTFFIIIQLKLFYIKGIQLQKR